MPGPRGHEAHEADGGWAARAGRAERGLSRGRPPRAVGPSRAAVARRMRYLCPMRPSSPCAASLSPTASPSPVRQCPVTSPARSGSTTAGRRGRLRRPTGDEAAADLRRPGGAARRPRHRRGAPHRPHRGPRHPVPRVQGHGHAAHAEGQECSGPVVLAGLRLRPGAHALRSGQPAAPAVRGEVAAPRRPACWSSRRPWWAIASTSSPATESSGACGRPPAPCCGATTCPARPPAARPSAGTRSTRRA